jgi:hypothetical protein
MPEFIPIVQVQQEYKDKPVAFLSYSVSRRDSKQRLKDLTKQYKIEHTIGNLNGEYDVFGRTKIPNTMIIQVESMTVVWERPGIVSPGELSSAIDSFLGDEAGET